MERSILPLVNLTLLFSGERRPAIRHGGKGVDRLSILAAERSEFDRHFDVSTAAAVAHFIAARRCQLDADVCYSQFHGNFVVVVVVGVRGGHLRRLLKSSSPLHFSK